MIRVLFVCLGNICRSPTAEGVFRHLVECEGLEDKITADSAGTGTWHIGQEPDKRSQRVAKSRGIDLSGLRGRQAKAQDFEIFDYVLAMDSSNYNILKALCPRELDGRLYMFLSFAPDVGRLDVPDPYYEDGFEGVFDMLEKGSKGLLADIRERHGL